jgi:thermolysin
MKRSLVACCSIAAAAAVLVGGMTIKAAPALIVVTPTDTAALRAWDGTVTGLARDGELRLRQQKDDPLVAGRVHERFDQYYKGVPVFGGQVTRQLDRGQTVSIFGTIYQGITLETTDASLTPDEAKAAIEQLAGAQVGDRHDPELVVLPTDSGSYELVYRLRVLGQEGLMMYFLDARSGSLVLKYSDLKTVAAKGIGKGVLGDDKKMSVSQSGSTFQASDELRPPAIDTFDMRGNVLRTLNFLNGLFALSASDYAADTDNTWTDPAVVDAHAHAGWVYDFFFKRFGRRGLDDRDIRMVSLVHPANRQDILRQPASIVGLFYLNAAYYGNGIMVYGEGLPANMTDGSGRSWNYTSGGLDIVAHELTHGVTDYTSQLIYRNESGALNEAFSDIMAVAVEFSVEPPGGGPLQADYLLGEDVITPGGVRSVANPAAFGDPDHYSRRYTGASDNGGVHTNGAIASHAFYLAIEGGANRTSRLTVEGVGAANREQIETVFYRAFTQLLPSNATFGLARAATLQAARDLYGAGSAAERALAQAWTAVGVS